MSYRPQPEGALISIRLSSLLMIWHPGKTSAEILRTSSHWYLSTSMQLSASLPPGERPSRHCLRKRGVVTKPGTALPSNTSTNTRSYFEVVAKSGYCMTEIVVVVSVHADGTMVKKAEALVTEQEAWVVTAIAQPCVDTLRPG